jgi:hypothetical protein
MLRSPRLLSAALILWGAGSASFAQAPAAQELTQAGSSAGAARAVFDGGSGAGEAAAVAVPGPGRAGAGSGLGAAPKGRASGGGPHASPHAAASPSGAAPSGAAASGTAGSGGRISDGFLGLYPDSEFTLTTGRRCVSCNAPKEGLWYFEDEVIAVPKTGTPSLVWIGSTELLEHAFLSPDGRSIRLQDGTTLPLALVPKIPSNRSYFNEASVAYLQDRPLRLRGEFEERDGRRVFVARTIWPEDQRIDFAALPAAPAKSAGDIDALVTADDGGARSPFSATLLWENGRGRAWGGKPVLGLMLNGAQGDDDEAHAGHFSMFTGRMGPDGEMADWMFDNFYDMDQYSEKGIVAGLVPMDKYMDDLNSGQSYYRGTHMIVAVLKDEALALRVQEQFRLRYQQYYSHALKYDRTFNPCAALVEDVLRADGWNYPLQGRSSDLSRAALTLITAVGSMDRAKGRLIYDVMSQEKTHLFPRAGFDSLSGDLLSLAGAGQAPGRALTPFERELQDDLEALIFVRLPQIPSSRAFGRYPVASTEEYFHRTPLLHSRWKTVPSVPRPFPPPH